MHTCKYCQIEITGSYCPNCGSPKEVKRINRHYIIEEISSVINFEKGLFYTIKELFLRPGITIKNYIDGDRKRIVKPIIFLIICSLIYTVAQQFFDFEAGLITFELADPDELPITLKLFDWFSSNYGYANILIAIFITFWIKLLFRKHNYNIFEIYILLCFIMGNSILMYAILGTIDSITGLAIFQIGMIISLGYNTWAIAQFFGKSNKINYAKSLLSYFLGMVSCIAVFFTIGIGLEKLLQ